MNRILSSIFPPLMECLGLAKTVEQFMTQVLVLQSLFHWYSRQYCCLLCYSYIIMMEMVSYFLLLVSFAVKLWMCLLSAGLVLLSLYLP